MYAIDATNLTKYYKKGLIKALRGLTFNVKEGELFGLIGPNGAGKSTTLKILATLLYPDAGDALVNGFDIKREPEQVRMSIGVCFEAERAFHWRLTVLENLLLFGSYYYIPLNELRRRIDILLDKFDLKEKKHTLVGKLSRGQRQRVAIVRALLPDPPILLLDEPWTGLDPENRMILLNYLKDLSIKEGRTLIVSSHELRYMEELCNRVLMLYRGIKVAEGNPFELMQKVETGEKIVMEIKHPDRLEYYYLKLKKLPEIQAIEREESILKIYVEDVADAIKAIYSNVPRNHIYKLSIERTTLEDAFFYYVRRARANERTIK